MLKYFIKVRLHQLQ